jgi:hypothetical protein
MRLDEACEAQGASTRTGARILRYADVNLSGIAVRRASTEQDFETVAHLRKRGYSRFSEKQDSQTAWVDEIDRMQGNAALIACDDDGNPVATMRMQDSRVGPLELSRFVPLDALLRPELTPALQIGRLSVLKGPRATDAMFGMFKAAWRWCLRNGIGSMVIASPPWARHFHSFMHFEDLGEAGNFRHALARDALHITMALSVQNAEDIWRQHENALCGQVFDTFHPSLEIGWQVSETGSRGAGN